MSETKCRKRRSRYEPGIARAHVRSPVEGDEPWESSSRGNLMLRWPLEPPAGLLVSCSDGGLSIATAADSRGVSPVLMIFGRAQVRLPFQQRMFRSTAEGGGFFPQRGAGGAYHKTLPVREAKQSTRPSPLPA